MPHLTIAVAAAFVNELGLSSPYLAERNGTGSEHPDLTREQVESVADYVRALSPPPHAPVRDGDRANGNLTSDGSRTYTWNARNQLSALAGPVSGSFGYDGFARRRTKTIGGVTTAFLYDGLNPVQELSGGSPSANLLTGLGIDEYLTRTDATGARSLLTDALGSTLALADSGGTIQTEYTYEPFGAFTTSGLGTTNSLAFTGRESDATGLMHYRARYYDSARQRFISEDPFGQRGGLNLFAYAANRPTKLTDPFGLKPSPDFGAAGGGASSASHGGGGGDGGAGGAPQGFPPPGCRGKCLENWLAAHPVDVKLGAIPVTPGGIAGVINGFTKHGIDRILERGVTPQEIIDAVRNPVDVVTKIDAAGRTSMQYIGQGATVVLNTAGRVVTLW